MQPLSDKSSFVRIKEALTSENIQLLIDKNGSFSQKETFDIYCGLINELSSEVNKGDICLISPTMRKETIVIAYAVVALGGIVIFASHNTPLPQFLKEIKTKIDIDVIITYEDDKWIATKEEKQIVLSLSRQLLSITPNLVASKDTPSFYFFTSGSTGMNNIVAISEYSFVNHLMREMDDLGANHTISYGCLTLNHVFGFGVYTQHLLGGKSIYISETRNPETALDMIEKYKCSTISNVPTFFYMLIDAQRKKQRDISSLSSGVIAGGGYSKEQFLTIEKELGLSLCSSYGMSEASTVITNMSCNVPVEERCEGVGKPFPGVDVVLIDDNGDINQDYGEICFKGYNMMLGYVNNNKIFLPLDKNKYFHTGDIARIDKKGIFHIVGRKKDIIIRGGENLSPFEIEQKIVAISGIKDVAVVGIDNPKYGEVVGAYVVSDKYQHDELLEILKNILLKSEMPHSLIVSKEIPLLANGKHDKQTIKKLLVNLDEE